MSIQVECRQQSTMLEVACYCRMFVAAQGTLSAVLVKWVLCEWASVEGLPAVKEQVVH